MIPVGTGAPWSGRKTVLRCPTALCSGLAAVLAFPLGGFNAIARIMIPREPPGPPPSAGGTMQLRCIEKITGISNITIGNTSYSYYSYYYYYYVTSPPPRRGTPGDPQG